MKKKQLLIAALIAGGSLSTLQSLAQFSLSGQFRPRTEIRNGFKKPVTEQQEISAFTEQRSRLTAKYKSGSVETGFSIQDVRIWGEVGQINKSDNLLSVHEAYAIYKADSLGKSSFKIGRQELVYDDHRVLGSLGWAAQARSHDALKYVYKDSDSTWQIHAIGTWNQDGSPAEPGKLQNDHTAEGGTYFDGGTSGSFNLPNPKTAMYLWFNTKLNGGKGGNVSLIGMAEGYQNNASTTTVNPLYTVGVTPTLKFGDVKLHSAFYYQAGSVNDVDVAGMMAHLDVTLTGGKVKPTLGFDFLSGDDKSTTEIEGFNPLHGTHHKFYGFMDYFYVGNGHNGGGNGSSGGLLDAYFKTAFPVGKSKLVTHLHMFMSPTDVASVGGETLGSYLGTELDLVWVKKLKDGVTFKAGYSQLFHSEGMSGVKGVDHDITSGNQSWGWVMINFAPKFL